MSEAIKTQPLAGKGIVVTRPAHQAQGLARLIEGAGGRSILFPAIDIRDVEDPGPFTRLIDRLDQFDLAIFISPNAAERAMSLISARRKFPAGLRVATIGGGGVRALEAHGVTGVIAPQGRYDSEALLELAEIAGARQVVIFRAKADASCWRTLSRVGAGRICVLSQVQARSRSRAVAPGLGAQ